MQAPRFSIAIVFALLLGGCAIATIEKGMTVLTGQHIDTAINYLGIPASDTRIAGRRVVVWTREESVSVPNVSTSQSNGKVGSDKYEGTTQTTTYTEERRTCTIKVSLDSESKINHWEQQGEDTECEVFAARLKPLVPRK